MSWRFVIHVGDLGLIMIYGGGSSRDPGGPEKMERCWVLVGTGEDWMGQTQYGGAFGELGLLSLARTFEKLEWGFRDVNSYLCPRQGGKATGMQ